MQAGCRLDADAECFASLDFDTTGFDPARELTVVALTNVGFEGLFGAYTREIRDAAYAVAD